MWLLLITIYSWIHSTWFRLTIAPCPLHFNLSHAYQVATVLLAVSHSEALTSCSAQSYLWASAVRILLYSLIMRQNLEETVQLHTSFLRWMYPHPPGFELPLGERVTLWWLLDHHPTAEIWCLIGLFPGLCYEHTSMLLALQSLTLQSTQRHMQPGQ